MFRTLVLTTLLAVAACTTPPAPPEPPAPQSAGDVRSAEILKRYPAPGRMVDIGGRRLHVLCRGPESGPTVIVETGAIASSVFYWQAQDEIARTARVCVYDRAGLGWSDPAPLPRTLKQ
ncbi:MAG TPA: hypothetical protein VFV70_13685, partial [Hyphomonadaceae bacterium]|nr:hypothetical protein [Hyphomonadaceae bacterium]